MRILLIHSRYRSGAASGENQVVEDEARLLAQGGHDVSVWSPTPEVRSGLGLLRTATDAVWSREAVREVMGRIDDHRPDVVHCHNILTGLSPTVVRAARSKGIPVVVTLHNYRLMCLPGTFLRDGRPCEDCLGHIPWRGVRYSCYRESRAASSVLAGSISLHRALDTFKQVNLFLAVSRFVRDKHIQATISPNRITVKPNFVWPAARRTEPGDYFLYIGRLAPEKGVATLVEAWQDAPARLLIVGEGSESAGLRAIAPPSVEFRDTVPHSEALELLRSARALVIPSLWYEGAPRSILEAYSVGVPVLASRIGALPEVVEEGVSGMLLTPGDAHAWRQAAVRMFDDAEAAKLSAGAWDLWNKLYRPEVGLQNLESAYRHVLTGRRSK